MIFCFRLILYVIFFGNLFVSYTFLHGFATLSDARKYAQIKEELPTIENKNFLNPEYNSFHKKGLEGPYLKKWNSFLRFVGIKREPLWTVKEFERLLDKVVAGRDEGRIIFRFTPKTGSKFIVFGDLQGAFHSFVRCLEELKNNLGIIDDNLNIVKTDHYLVFNGDLIDRSPYILETLTLVMRLMEQNPDKVFYIRGNHEDNELWQNYGLRRELEIRAESVSDEDPPLGSQVKRFFNTLPIALFLRIAGKPEFICFSHYGLEEGKLKKHYYSNFLLKGDYEKVKTFDLTTARKSKKFVSVEAILKGVSRSTSYLETDGLTLLTPDHGATAWGMLSAPTLVYRKIYDFYYDAFSIVDVGGLSVDDWTITLHNRNVLKNEGFSQKGYYLVSGHSKEKLPLKGSIDVGSTMDLSKSALVYSVPLLQGISLRFNKENSDGGINGKRLRLIVLDHEYSSNLAVKRAKQLLNDYKVNMIIGNVGTASTKALLPYIEQEKLLMMFPFTGSAEFRNAKYSHLVHFRATYSDESQKLIDYAVERLLIRTFALFYQDDEYGYDCLKGARTALKRHNINKWIETSYPRNTINVEASVAKIMEFNPVSIVFFANYTPASVLVGKLGYPYVANKILIGNSIMAFFQDFMQAKGLNFISSRVITNPKSDELEIAREYKEELKKQGLAGALSSESFEGYINASLVIEAMKRINGSITKEKIIEEMEKMQNYNFKGLTLNFDLQTRSFSKDIWIDEGTGGPWIYVPENHKENHLNETRRQSVQKPVKFEAEVVE